MKSSFCIDLQRFMLIPTKFPLTQCQSFALPTGLWHQYKKGVTLVRVTPFICGATRNRTGDTRIFSPLLYQLSYGTNTVLLNCGCKGTTNI